MADPREFRRWLVLTAEIVLVVAILALLALTWLPAIIGPHAGTPIPGR